MRWIVFFTALACAGGVLSALLCTVPGKRRAWAFAPLCVLASAGLWLLCLYLYARWQKLSFTRAAVLPDRLSVLVWAWIYLLLTLLISAALGCLRAGGLRAYLRGCVGSPVHRLALGGFLGGSLLLVLGCAVLAGSAPPSPLRLSEACCCNFSLSKDPNTGEYEDYIELENTGDEPLLLEGCFLSDSAKKRNRFRLPRVTLGAGERLLLWADGKGQSGKGEGEAISLNFTLDPGETVWLTSPHGILLDHVTLAQRAKNISMTRRGEGWIQAEGTPGRAEETEEYLPATLQEPALSAPSGFYAEPLRLTVEAAPGCTVHYTLDGSVPDADDPVFPESMTLTDRSAEPNRVLSQRNTTLDRSGAVTEPVDKGTVLRLVAVNDAGAYSPTVTAVYFVGETFAKYEGQAVLSIVADPEDLFGDSGICVTGAEYDAWYAAGGTGRGPEPAFNLRGRETERDASAALWDEQGTPVLDTACGIRLQGDSSRVRAIKRFTLYARPIYGTESTFSASVFANRLTHSFCTRPNVHDVMAQALTAGLGLGGQESRKATVFLNGELYSETYLRERYDAQYFESHFGVASDDLIVVSNNERDIGTAEDYEDYLALMEWLQASDCADPVVWQRVCQSIDVENYATFVAANLYLNNTDWSVYKNYKLWRSRSSDGEGFRDGRWRWLVYDMDGCYWTRSVFEDAPRASYDLFSYSAPVTGEPFAEMPVFRDLLRNPSFRELFSRTWLELMNHTFSYERALPLLERWELTEDAFWPEFLTQRPNYAPQLLIRALKLPGEPCALSLSVSAPEGGAVRLEHSVLSGGDWSGTWVTGVALTLTAEPAEGWRFVGWRGDAGTDAQTVTLTPTGDTELTAMFEKNK